MNFVKQVFFNFIKSKFKTITGAKKFICKKLTQCNLNALWKSSVIKSVYLLRGDTVQKWYSIKKKCKVYCTSSKENTAYFFKQKQALSHKLINFKFLSLPTHLFNVVYSYWVLSLSYPYCFSIISMSIEQRQLLISLSFVSRFIYLRFFS